MGRTTSTPALSAEAPEVADGDLLEAEIPGARLAVVGETVDLPPGETLLVLPDGTAVTCRAFYRVTAPGTYRCGDLVIEVAEPDHPELDHLEAADVEGQLDPAE